MKYEEIKVGDVFDFLGGEETVISKNDKYRFIVTIDYEEAPTSWSEDELHFLEPLKEQLPEEGLLVSRNGTIIYRTGEFSGYGFRSNGNYKNLDGELGAWNFDSHIAHWKPATQEQEAKFKEMLKKECEKRGLYEDTKLDKFGINSDIYVNSGVYSVVFDPDVAWNKNGRIFYKGKFATPLKEKTTLELVSKAVQEIGDFTIEQTESGVIILTPIKTKNE